MDPNSHENRKRTYQLADLNNKSGGMTLLGQQNTAGTAGIHSNMVVLQSGSLPSTLSLASGHTVQLAQQGGAQHLQTTALLNCGQTSDGSPMLIPVSIDTSGNHQAGQHLMVTSNGAGGLIHAPPISPSSGTSNNNLEGDSSSKRQMRLLKNREAARDCRRKKKEYVRCLESRVTVLENQNQKLIEELHRMKSVYAGTSTDPLRPGGTETAPPVHLQQQQQQQQQQLTSIIDRCSSEAGSSSSASSRSTDLQPVVMATVSRGGAAVKVESIVSPEQPSATHMGD